MLIGGFDPVFADQGGEQNEKTWIFNTTHWKSTAPSLVARDRPACCIVNMPDGKVCTTYVHLMKLNIIHNNYNILYQFHILSC